MPVVQSSPARRGVNASPWTDCLVGGLPLKAVSPSPNAVHLDLASRMSVLRRRTTNNTGSSALERTVAGRNEGILRELEPGCNS